MSATKNYISAHVYYNATDLRPVLLDCVEPLVRSLQRQDLLERFFFIRYWEGGSHVRLRLLPRSDDVADNVRQQTETALQRFLEDRPSFFDADPETLRPLMRTLFEFEYGKEEFERLYGDGGDIPIADNNTFSYCAYRPEYDRYGGVDGIELSERHFEVSSAVALEALRDSNSHVRSSLLGLALQLMLHFATAALRQRELVIDFFRAYVERWQGLSVPDSLVAGLNRLYEQQAPRLRAHFEQVSRLHEGLEAAEDTVIGKWLHHAYWMRENVARLYHEGRLELRPAPDSETDAMRRLMVSYIHMMNNRLGVLILEEVYLARVIVQALGGTV